MTRGTLHLISSYKTYAVQFSASEFNGDMYPGGHYEEAIKRLQAVKTPVDFYKTVLEFDKVEGFNYQDEGNGYFQFKRDVLFSKDHENNVSTSKPFVSHTDPLIIDLRRDYFEHWFSDYIFFKVTGDTPVQFIDDEGEEIIVDPTLTDKPIAFNFGHFMSELKYKEQTK